MLDEVSKPAHYQGDGIECMEAMKSMMAPLRDRGLPPEAAYWWGCAFKYLWRWPLKGGSQDLKKARQCINYLLDAAYAHVTKAPEMLHDETSEVTKASEMLHEDTCEECDRCGNCETYRFANRIREVAMRDEDLYVFGKHYIMVDDEDAIVSWFIDKLVNGLEWKEEE